MEKVIENGKLLITHEGMTKSVAQWCAEFGVPKQTVYGRIRMGLPFEKVFSHEKQNGKRSDKSRKRGCLCCADRINSKCIHKECPYHELDNVKSYTEYLKKAKKNGLINILEEME